MLSDTRCHRRGCGPSAFLGQRADAHPDKLPAPSSLRPRRQVGWFVCCILCCMSAIRTQVYLTDEQRRLIDEITRAQGVTLAEVVRRALDVYLCAERDPTPALDATFGADPDAHAPSRDEWDHA